MPVTASVPEKVISPAEGRISVSAATQRVVAWDPDAAWDMAAAWGLTAVWGRAMAWDPDAAWDMVTAWGLRGATMLPGVTGRVVTRCLTLTMMTTQGDH